MYGILNNLEPIKFEKYEIIYDEADEMDAVYFVMNNAYFQVGYSFNHKRIFKIRLKNNNIGAFGVTFKKKSRWAYRA